MNGDVTRKHYDRLAATFDENWAYSPAFTEWMTAHILARLHLAPGEVAADIGCGTGLYARGLAGQAEQVVCVDASAAMLSRLPADDRLVPVVASAEEVAAGQVHLPAEGLDAMLLKEVLHHVPERATVTRGLARLLRPGGRMLVVMLPTRISYPLFADALTLFTTRQPDPASIADAMAAAGLAVQVTQESFPLVFATERYLGMVRNRYMSLLSHFSDVELEAGVEEIRRGHAEEQVAFEDRFVFVLGVAA